MIKFEIDEKNNIIIDREDKKFSLSINIKEDRKYSNITIQLTEDELDSLISKLISIKAE